MQIVALIVDSFRESLDRKIFWVMLLITLAVASAMFCVSFEPHRINLLFGTWSIANDGLTIGNQVSWQLVAGLLVEYIADLVLGLTGILLALIATAGFFPAMMGKGEIEVVLSKPLSRARLFFGKYLGSLTFIAFQAAFFVALTFLVAGIRWHVWVPRYFLIVPLMVLMFSYLYCISVLVAVTTGSTVSAILITIFAWLSFFGIQLTGDLFETKPQLQEYRSVYYGVQVVRWIIPKTTDLTLNARTWARIGNPTDILPVPRDQEHKQHFEDAVSAEQRRQRISPLLTIGSSLGFEVAILFIAMWKFSRKDF